MDFQVIIEDNQVITQTSRVFSAIAGQKMSKTMQNGRRFCYIAVETLTQSVHSAAIIETLHVRTVGTF